MLRRPAVALAMIVLAGTGLAAAPAAAAEPPIFQVGPHQYFTAQVNHKSADATITMICPGPVATGHPASGQTIGVVLVSGPVIGSGTSVGYTGDAANSINATRPDSTSTTPIAVFTYYTDQPLSTKLTLPCSGTGTIVFLPSPNVAGRGATVTVQFVSITV